MPTLNFTPRFADAVAAGVKTQTIRPIGKRVWKVGDRAVCLAGQRRKGKCRRLCEGVVVEVRDVHISWSRMMVAGVELSYDDSHRFAKADGFASPGEMAEWFDDEHGLPFVGRLIRWKVKKGGA
jgi:hypothetical protein